MEEKQLKEIVKNHEKKLPLFYKFASVPDLLENGKNYNFVFDSKELNGYDLEGAIETNVNCIPKFE
jgi:hypothetical protein